MRPRSGPARRRRGTPLSARDLTGRETALRAAFEAHAPGVVALAARLVGAEAARDVCQETFVRYHDHLDEVRGEPGPWLAAVAWRLALDRARRGRRERRALEALSLERSRSAPPAPDPVESAEVRDSVLEAVSELPGRQRDVFLLRVLGAETFVSIARALGVSEGAAKVHLRRAVERLRRTLAPLAAGVATKEKKHELR